MPHMTPDERKLRILDLLEHYQDALPGLVSGGEWETGRSAEGHAQLADAVWNHPCYRQLERLRVHLRDDAPRPYWHLAETYFRSGSKRIARCPRCGREASWERIDSLCNHGKRHAKTTAMVAGRARVVSAAVDTVYVELALRWLEHNWRGTPRFVAEILEDIARRKREQVAA